MQIEDKIANIRVKGKLKNFLKWVLVDIIKRVKYGTQFNEFGMTMYVGKQGAGKTIAMCDYLNRMKEKYPDCIIVTNFGYKDQDFEMVSWKQLVNIKNGEDGVIFAIDEIQNEFDSNKWKDFPEQLLSQVTQQRKQRLKIIATSQVFTRVVKQLREQCFEVVECKTIAGRWTICRTYDAWDYELCNNSSTKKEKLYSIRKHSFIQDEEIRNQYDTYKIVERLASLEMIPRQNRAANI